MSRNQRYISRFLLPVVAGALTLLLQGCSGERKYWSPAEARQFADSAAAGKLVAAYLHDSACSLIMTIPGDSIRAVRVTKRRGFPIQTDTLRRERNNVYASGRYNYRYVVTDTSVTEDFYQKIVHPSSNWQGQTPGVEVISTRYSRQNLE